PKYRSSVWSIIMLAQLGASVNQDARLGRACQYLLDHALTKYGQFSTSGTPGSTADCLQGNLCAAMLDLGFEDSRLLTAFDWMARSVTGEDVATMGDISTPIRYYAGKCGPGFACGANNKQPCAWGAVKVMLAFSKLPKAQRTRRIQEAIQQGIAFLLGVDPVTAAYPTWDNRKPSSNWWKFGFPIFYVTDFLQIAEVLVRLGLGSDLRLGNTLAMIRKKQDAEGRWPLEYDYTGKTWVDFGKKKHPNKWVTLRAAWVLINCCMPLTKN
ncbi:MAG: nitrogen fixation protein NifH, partial [Anaerolineales bacterium]